MRDMTTGSPRSHLWRYATPLLLGNGLQLLYNAVDSMIAGRFIGRGALAAEGIAAPVMNLVILAVTGLCIGAGVLMSEAFGAKDAPRLRRCLAETLRFGALFCCAAAALAFAFCPAILRLLAVPPELRALTGAYLRVILLGTPFTFFYNALSTALRSAGDAKTPLRFLAFSSVLNAALDLIFLGLLGFGVVCSAVTTLVAEAASALMAGAYMLRRFPELFPRREDWARERSLLAQILHYGVPSAMQQAVMPVGKVIIQGQINALGVNVIAAFNAVSHVDDFALIPAQSLSAAISTYIAQNRGAKKSERIRPGMRAGLALELSYWALIACAVLALRAGVVSLFVTGEGARDIVALGSRYLGYMAFFYLIPAFNNTLQGFFRGTGRMVVALAGTSLQIAVRALGTVLLAPRMGMTGVALACALGWALMFAYEAPTYFVTCRRLGYPRGGRK